MATKYRGYQLSFISRTLKVPLPKLSRDLKKNLAPIKGTRSKILRYPNYSVLQHAERRLPILSAANINGDSFKKITRKAVKGSWRKDRRLSYQHQWGSELYKATMSDFDKGHMTKREDVQWGRTRGQATIAAKKTFYYTNAAPQHAKLNQAIWRNIEDYILHDETIAEHLKINVFTGPVLRVDDPEFVTEVRGERIQLPTLFWKVVYYTKGYGELYRACFMAGQGDILEREGIIWPQPTARGMTNLFMDFEEADTYQVSVGLVESLTGLQFPPAIDLLWDHRPVGLVIEQVNVRGMGGVSRFVKGLQL